MDTGPRKPIFNLPGVVLLVLAALAAVHLVRLYGLSDADDARLLRLLAFVPAQFTFLWAPDAIAAAMTELARTGRRDELAAAYFFLDIGRAQWWTPVAYSFLHADWTHLIINSLWLAAFGSPVALRIGVWRFVAFFIFTAQAGAVVHFLSHPTDAAPVIGASAAVSGLTAAALRFIFQPGAPLGPAYYGALPPDLAVRQPALSVREACRDRRVLQFAAVWFVVNLLFGLLAQPMGLAEFGVAWEAHAGGFLAGFLLFSVFDRRHPPINLPPMGLPPDLARMP